MPRFVLSIGLMGLLAACAAPEGGPQRNSSAILPAEIQAELKPGEGDFAPDLVYVSERARDGGYDKIMLDPVMYFAPLEAMRSVSPGDRQTLANNFHILMGRELGKDFLLAVEPQRGAVRVQFAVLPVTQEPVAMDTVALVARDDPEKQVVVDALASPVSPGADLLVEAEWTDAVTGEVLGATVDRHFGQKSFDGTSFKSWAEVNRYLEAYAVLIRYRLCVFRGGSDCTPPSAPLG
ncbi:DUF3313 family protein [Pelagibius sp. CAU 1746]|uniref:DUF3313 family protein n=1 Tax=Pelagibius sp. CAU 1746 TaxID=3140370 RepID=UPI00325B23E1